MTKAFYIFSFLIVSHFNSFSQNSVNDYKYIIVPAQFEFLKQQDQYEINSLTKFLFNKYGYTAYMQNEEFPEDLSNNGCLGLIADVVKENSFLKTKIRIDLKDCFGNVIKSSQVGETREKEYAKAYNLALRGAFETYQHLGYVYQPNENILSNAKPQVSKSDLAKEQEEITRLKEEIKTLKDEKEEHVEVEKAKVEENVEESKQASEPKEKMVVMAETKELTSEVLYAQPIDNGFQIVDTTPKKVMILLNSGVKDVFKVEGKKAIVFKKGDVWMYSESGDILKGEVINIKF